MAQLYETCLNDRYFSHTHQEYVDAIICYAYLTYCLFSFEQSVQIYRVYIGMDSHVLIKELLYEALSCFIIVHTKKNYTPPGLVKELLMEGLLLFGNNTLLWENYAWNEERQHLIQPFRKSIDDALK